MNEILVYSVSRDTMTPVTRSYVGDRFSMRVTHSFLGLLLNRGILEGLILYILQPDAKY